MVFDQVFDSKESLSTAAECVKVAKEHCQQLTEIGLDLTFTLQSLLVKDVKAALLSYKDIIMEATKHRNSEEMWRRLNLMTPEALAKLKVGLTPACFLIFSLSHKCIHSVKCTVQCVFLSMIYQYMSFWVYH